MNTLVLVLALQGGPVTGELTSVSDDGKRIRVNLGRDSGLRVQDTLRVYSAPEIVTLPGTGKAAFAVEREVGAAVVVEVLPNELVAQVVGGAEPFSRGFRVVPGKAVRRGALPPHIRERVSLEPAAPVWGRPVAVTIDVEDLDGDFARVECRVDRGLLLDPVSTARKVRWMPPAEAGEARLTVRAFDRAGGSDERTFVLRYDGPSAAARPAAFALESVFDTPFVEAADLAGDEDGNVYILDRTLRRVVKWGPSGQRAWVSEPWDRDVDFTRMIVSGAEGIFLDRLGRRAVRYALDPAMFTAPPARVYGGKRRGPSAVREPIDLAVLPEGDVWILDAGEGTIRTFAEDGSYQTTVGSFQEPRAMRRGRSAAVHVVDAGARQVLTFEGGRMTRRTALPAEELPVDLLEPSQLLFADRWGNRPLSGARAVRLDGFGRIYVIEADGRAILRLASDGPDARRLASFPLEAQTVRALPDGGFALEDGRERLEFDAEGWLRRRGRPEGGPRRDRDAVGNPFGMSDDGGLRCGEKALDVGRLRVADFDLDPFGRVLLVEGGTGRVLRLGIARWAE